MLVDGLEISVNVLISGWRSGVREGGVVFIPSCVVVS